jgi:prepilin-type N-terminal cleavage/methylation domain-containing protein
MKLLNPIRNQRGFTLPEVLTAMTIFLMLVTATVSSQIFGLRMYRISEAKLLSTGDARNAVNHVQDEIRSATLLYVGNGDSISFSLISSNAPRVGNALKICPTSDTNTFVWYYVDPTNNCLMRRPSGYNSPEVISENVTNRVAFQAEDFQGNIVTNNQNHRIIRFNLEFSKLEYSSAAGGSSRVCDSFRLQSRMTRRAL